MYSKQALAELKRRTEHYRLFWEEWSHSESCCLSAAEIALVNTLLKNGFKPSVLKRLLPFDQDAPLKSASRALLRSYPALQDWVIFRFLCLLLHMARTQQSGFLDRPVKELPLPEEMKHNLQSFKIHHLRQLACAYKADDLKRNWVYSCIVDFHRLSAKYGFSPSEASIHA